MLRPRSTCRTYCSRCCRAPFVSQPQSPPQQQASYQLRSVLPFSSATTKVTGPQPTTKSWQSGAKLVKNTSVENKYLDHIREVHDPSQHIKTIEDELKGTIGKALGKQGQKILMYARSMEQERKEYEKLLEQEETSNEQLAKVVTKHNEYRDDCVKARWELIVHRQAVGFIVGNHEYVMDKFPIAEALSAPKQTQDNQGGDETSKEDDEKPKKKFGDQLDWWQTIGRWR